MKVHVLGAGPAGLLVAHAARQAGHTPVIHGIRERSQLRGAVYLHSRIPDLTKAKPDATLTYVKKGTAEGYAEKVYGDPEAPCSWDRFEGEVKAWNLDHYYGKLWDEFNAGVADQEIRAQYIRELLAEGDPVFSTINPLGYCELQGLDRPCQFVWQEVRIHDEVQDGVEDCQIVYNGDPLDRWYRSSRIFDYGSTEYPFESVAGYGYIPVKKPLSTDCQCLLEAGRLYRVGRYGAFQKHLLVDDAYRTAVEIFNGM